MPALPSPAAPSFGTPAHARVRALFPGLLLAALLAASAIGLGRIDWLQAHGLSPLTLAIVLGIVVGNTLFARVAGRCGAGVGYAKQDLLRLGIVLYGFRLTFQDIGQVGLGGVLVDALMLGSTFALAVLLGTRVFRLERGTAMLIGAGSSICGAAAVMATEPVLRARAEQVTVAVSTVVVFGTLAIFVYPLLYRLNLEWRLFDTSAAAFGLYAGSTIHEVAQVVAAARALGPEAADAAVIAKMVRVMMLAPFLLGLSVWLGRSERGEHGTATPARRVTIPWFAFAFVAVAGFNSLGLLPRPLLAAIGDVDTALLAMAMAALGLSTHLSAVRRAGVKPLLLAGLLFAWLIGGGALINHALAAY
ncbi:MAG: YeiH family putative sulfate export transporter [Burkholderiaceae bacterium]